MEDEAESMVNHAIERIRTELEGLTGTTRRRVIEKFALAALSSIPWVGGLISAAASLKTDEGAAKTDSLQTQWLEVHSEKLEHLAGALREIGIRFEDLGEHIDERIQSDEYLGIVRQAFATWDRAETEDKRGYVCNLVANAAGTRICSDDVVRLFVDWLDQYHEAHFLVVREIFRNPGCSRYEIWMAIYGELVREDSAEADLFRLIVRDLSTGGVVRQERETTEDGRFLRKRRTPQKHSAGSTMESAFDDSKSYVLTELGRQFVHYTMSEMVQRIPANDET